MLVGYLLKQEMTKYKYTRKECNKEIETIKRIFSGSQIMPGGWLETVTQYLHATQLMLLAQKEDRKELLTDKNNRVMTNKKNKSSSISSEIDCVQTPIIESDHIEEIDKSVEHLWFGKQINSLIRNQKKLYQYIKEKSL